MAMIKDYLTPRWFLIIGGVVLLVLGLVGFAGIFSKTSTPAFWLDSGENVAHVGLGVIALAAVYVPSLNTMLAPYYRWIVILVGIIALFFGVYGFVVSSGTEPNTFGISNLENPADNLLHLVVAIWAFASVRLGMTPQAK